uniref:Uncharacterized protein n=1 Tax=Meloidogyne hapla TaxID=6305 RepID=A0A1I8BBD3_MELHA
MYLYNLLFYFLILFLTILSCYTNKLILKDVECVADYLLLSQNVQTELIAEEIRGEWKIQRGISKELLGDMKINRGEMIKHMKEVFTNLCFSKLHKQQSGEFFVKDIKTTIFQDHLILSKSFQEKLSKQHECLIHLLYKKFGSKFVKKIVLPSHIKNGKVVILNHYKKLLNDNEYYTFNLKWNLDNYKKGTLEFGEVKKCNNHLVTQEL